MRGVLQDPLQPHSSMFLIQGVGCLRPLILEILFKKQANREEKQSSLIPSLKMLFMLILEKNAFIMTWNILLLPQIFLQCQ